MDFLARHVPGMPDIPSDGVDIAAEDATIVYYRVSDRSQVDTDYDPEGNSLPAQRECVEETARRLKKTIIGEYIEPGVSALPLDKRPAFRQMIDRIIAQRDVKYVIVYMLNRFARNRYEDAIVGLTLERLGVTVISAKEHIHGNDPSERMMRGMLAVYNQYQSEASSADIKEKLAHKARKGGTIGYAPLGYLNVTEEFEGRKINTITTDPQRAPYITHMAELYATGRHSFADIRQIITEQGLRTRPTKKHPAGTPISIGNIGKILSDRYYLGYITYQGIEYKGRHQPLISEELFERVQRVLATNTHSGLRRRVHHHPLKGLLWCARCKKRFVLANATGNGGTYLYLFCMGRKTHTCNIPYLRLDGPTGVEHAISTHYTTITLSEHTRQELAEQVKAAITTEHTLSEHIRTQLTKKLDQLETREDGLFALIGDPHWDRDKLNTHMRTLRKEKDDTHHQLSTLHTALDTGRQIFLTALDMLANPRRVYDTGPDEIKTLLTKTIFTKLYLDANDHGTITVTTTDLADPFSTITTTATEHAHTSTPDHTHPRDTTNLATRLTPWQPDTTVGGGTLLTKSTTPNRTMIISRPTLTTSASGSNKPCLVELGLFEPLAHERVFVGVTSTQPAWGGFHCPNPVPGGLPPGYRYVQAAAVVTRYGDLHGDVPSTPGIAGLDLIRTYTHDCLHWGTFRSYRLGNTGIHRNQHGINFRRENGSSYSARDPQGSASTRNLGIIMEGAFDREAAAVAREVAATAEIPCPTTGVDRYAWHDSTGDTLHAPESADPWLTAMSGYAASVTAPYAAFLAEIGGPDSDELHELLIRATLDGNLSPLQSWLEDRYGPGEFTALFRSDAYSRAT